MSITLLRSLARPNEAHALLISATLPPHLDGSQGQNRGVGRQQITANTDPVAVYEWLKQYADRETTYLAYEKEVIRFQIWCICARNKALSSITHEDWQAYLAFLKDPQPADQWIGTKRPRRAKDGTYSADYRPFAGPLNPKSVKYAEGIIWLLFEWLYGAGYLAGNPIIVSRKRKQRQQKRILTRFLNEEQWRAVREYIEEHPKDTRTDFLRYARLRWIASLFYITGMRTTEAVTGMMVDLFSIYDRQEKCNRYFVRTIGKGDKERNIPIPDDFLEEVRHYRTAFGLSPWPASGEETPLVFSIHTKAKFKPITRQAMYTIFKNLFECAAKRLAENDEDAAKKLIAASTHWMRHTAATDMLDNGTDMKTVQQILGHESIATTMNVYSHREDVKAHREISGKHSVKWQKR